MIKKTISIVTLLCTLVGCNAQKSAKNIEENEVAKTDQETVDTFTTSEGTSIKMYLFFLLAILTISYFFYNLEKGIKKPYYST